MQRRCRPFAMAPKASRSMTCSGTGSTTFTTITTPSTGSAAHVSAVTVELFRPGNRLSRGREAKQSLYPCRHPQRRRGPDVVAWGGAIVAGLGALALQRLRV
jgi:hypothetical protein